MAWFNTVEFYVVAGTLAAAVVALAALPQRRGPAVQHLLAGDLADTGNPAPQLLAQVDERGRLLLTRTGLAGIHAGGAVSLALTITGFDIKIEERLTPGPAAGAPVDTACFTLDFLGAERYHISYNSDDAGLFAAFTLPIRPGIRHTRPLR